MNFNTLTINNITKICEDKVIIDDNDNISIYQWFPFQLEYAMLNNKLPIIDKFLNRTLTPSQMCSILKDKFPNGVTVTGTNKELERYGFLKKMTIDDYTVNNIGGQMLFIPELNHNKSAVIEPEDIINYFKLE
jgi:hypothetical protein